MEFTFSLEFNFSIQHCSEDYSFIENESSLIHFSKFLTDLPDWEFVVRRFKNGQPSYPL